MSRAEDLRREGFRPIRPGSGAEFLPQIAREFGYQVVDQDGKLWIRKAYRKRGAIAPLPILAGPTIRRADVRDDSTYDFISVYQKSGYSAHQNRMDATLESLVRTVTASLKLEAPHQKFSLLTRPLAFCPTPLLREVLQNHILPSFFSEDSDGVVQVFLLNDEFEKSFSFLRAGYALDHYSQSELKGSQEVGFATLKAWEQGHLQDYVDPLLSILQVCMYPYIPLFSSGPLGASFIFLFSEHHRHEIGVFPTGWLQWARSDAGFAREDVDAIKGLSDSGSEEWQRLSHRRYRMDRPLDPSEFKTMLEWAIAQMGSLIREVVDPANCESRDAYIDFTFAYEHNLSMIRVFRRTLLALSTEEPPSGKFIAFEVADLLDRLASAHGKRPDAETFKLLFNPTDGPNLLKKCIAALPESPRSFVSRLTDLLYEDLQRTISASIWIQGKLDGRGVRVKTTDLATERGEGIGEYVGNLMRTLRNTHHGYFTRLDKAGRPSRYLALTTGDTPGSMSLLPFIWVIAVLADPKEIIGWNPLPVNAYE